ncbi:hypothetical protein TSA1_15410 [Bradyrhizobium nitroreducens]|uniref:Uncharacterized protein n=1 Tax=Bradyrhizobium nitroreducens TaxID=709803 RepID=A0A2M6UBL8_9BRAD|nr:hypothetical protein [Bradyrhizobium nitroreducens]PIT01996.1 hypothetical protein TSA1_15410 [Bradyrhizobium nitroreducens]
MRVTISGLALLALTSLPVAVQAAPCPPGTVEVCRPHTMRPPLCHCENAPGSGNLGGGGKAEIHKKSVPTVKPNKSPGPND